MTTPDLVRNNTSDEVNARLDAEMAKRIRAYSNKTYDDITHRIGDLDREWDMERVLEFNAATLALTGVVLGATVNKKWLVAPCVVLPFLMLHAVQGWCPPVPLFRRLGVRTRQEIDRERYAMKALRGDLDEIAAESTTRERADAAIDVAELEHPM